MSATTSFAGRLLARAPHAWERWDHWCLRECPPHLLAIFRIAFGGFILLYFALQLPYVDLRYSNVGLIQPSVEGWSPIALLFAGPPPSTAMFLFWCFLLAWTCVTIGLFTRVALGVSFLLYCYYWVLSIYLFGTSFDRLFLFITLVLCFSGCGETLSVDARRRYGSWFAWRPISILPQRLLAMQVAATYLGVGWQKMILPVWQWGEVISYGYVGRWATPLADWFIRFNLPMWFWDFLNFQVKCFEVTIPFGLWIRRWNVRWYFFAWGFFFHTFISLFLNIWWFQILIPAYIVFFEPEEITGALKKWFPSISARLSSQFSPITRRNN